ncbi:MAG: hypothetical protein RBS99_11440 [Rhodospirillales bacterium]|jgi:tripartite-type tricarboxylate transporter receptor subunit TctC|nr:hypothetical protein [Rhodospirillales bacterium]
MGWNWWLVCKDTPAPVVAKLRDAMGKALARKDVQDKLMGMDYEPLDYSLDEYEKIVGPVATDLQSGIDAIAWEKKSLQSLKK